jgi:hypothetical protein
MTWFLKTTVTATVVALLVIGVGSVALASSGAVITVAPGTPAVHLATRCGHVDTLRAIPVVGVSWTVNGKPYDGKVYGPEKVTLVAHAKKGYSLERDIQSRWTIDLYAQPACSPIGRFQRAWGHRYCLTCFRAVFNNQQMKTAITFRFFYRLSNGEQQVMTRTVRAGKISKTDYLRLLGHTRMTICARGHVLRRMIAP